MSNAARARHFSHCFSEGSHASHFSAMSPAIASVHGQTLGAARRKLMSREAAEQHPQAAEHHEHAARHHREAARHHDAGDHETAASITLIPGDKPLFVARGGSDCKVRSSRPSRIPSLGTRVLREESRVFLENCYRSASTERQIWCVILTADRDEKRIYAIIRDAV